MIFFIMLIQARFTQKERILVKDWPVGRSMGPFSDLLIDIRDQPTLGSTILDR